MSKFPSTRPITKGDVKIANSWPSSSSSKLTLSQPRPRLFPPSVSGTSFQTLDAYLSIRRLRRRAAMNLHGNDSRWHDRLVVLLEVDRLQSIEPNLHA